MEKVAVKAVSTVLSAAPIKHGMNRARLMLSAAPIKRGMNRARLMLCAVPLNMA